MCFSRRPSSQLAWANAIGLRGRDEYSVGVGPPIPMRFSGYSIDLLTCVSLCSYFFEVHFWAKSPGSSEELGSCIEWRGCACRKGTESCVPWSCKFMRLLLLFFSCQGEETPICKWLYAEKKLACQRAWPELLAGSEPWMDRFLCEQFWQGPSLNETLLLGSTWAVEAEARARWDGEISCPTGIRWGIRERQFIGQVQDDLLHLHQCVLFSPECLVVYAACQGNSLACLKRKLIVRGPGFWPRDFF